MCVKCTFLTAYSTLSFFKKLLILINQEPLDFWKGDKYLKIQPEQRNWVSTGALKYDIWVNKNRIKRGFLGSSTTHRVYVPGV